MGRYRRRPAPEVDMITPPRWIERLLSSFGAEPGYRDALLGDLAEEFTIRVEEQSAGIARRWYFREALRSAPHLFGSWLRRVGARDVLQLAGITVAALFAMRLFGIAIRLAIVLSFGVRPDSASIMELAWRDISSESLALALVPIVLTRAATLGLGVAGRRSTRRRECFCRSGSPACTSRRWPPASRARRASCCGLHRWTHRSSWPAGSCASSEAKRRSSSAGHRSRARSISKARSSEQRVLHRRLGAFCRRHERADDRILLRRGDRALERASSPRRRASTSSATSGELQSSLRCASTTCLRSRFTISRAKRPASRIAQMAEARRDSPLRTRRIRAVRAACPRRDSTR